MTNKKISGIYKIYNRVNNKIYVGSSNDISRRWCHHRTLLKRNKHHNIYLQRAYNKYGIDAFEYSIILKCSQQTLLEQEKNTIIYLDTLAPNGYNISSEPLAPFKNRRHTSNSKKMQSQKNSGKGNYWFGKKLEEKHNRKISQKNKRFTDEQEKEFYLRHTNGESIYKIAKEFNVHQTTIRRAIDRYIRFKEFYEESPVSAENT